ncbi:MAG: M55 family metallopeptidase [Pseudomonadota bacterium]
MRLYISADIEGVAGVVTNAQTKVGGFEWQQARRWMTAEVGAAIAGARAAGATDFVVSDSHGTGQNLLLDDLPEDVEVVRSWPRPLGMMQGIEHGSFDAAFLIGYHSAAHTPGGILAHTMSTRFIHSLRLNGEPASETGISAGIAGHFGVPIVLASGDDMYGAEVKQCLPSARFVQVKTAHGQTSARSMAPKMAQNKIEEAAQKSLSGPFPAPTKISTPIRLEVTFQRREHAELLSYLPNFERQDARTIGVTAGDMPSVSKIIMVIISLAPVDG